MGLVHQAIKNIYTFNHLIIYPPVHSYCTILHKLSNVFKNMLRRGIFLHLEIYAITCLLFLKSGNVPALSSFLLTWKKKKLLEIPNEGDGIPLGLFSEYPHKSNFSHCSSPSGLLLHYHWYYVLKLKLPRSVIINISIFNYWNKLKQSLWPSRAVISSLYLLHWFITVS